MAQSWSACVLKLDLYEQDRYCAVVISPNGRHFVRLDDDAVEVYNIGWSDMTRLIKLADSAKASFAPNGEHLAVCSKKGAIQVLDTKTGRRVWELMGHEDRINALAFSPNGKLLASASFQEIILWDLSTGHRLQTLDCENPIALSFSVDSGRLASGSHSSGEMRVWDVPSGDCIWSIRGHDETVNSLAFISRDFLVSGSYDKTVKIWDLAVSACTQTLQTDWGYPSVVSLQDGSRFAYFATYGAETVHICNERGVCVQTIIVGYDSSTTPDLVFLPGPQLLARTFPRELTLWDLAPKPTEQEDQESDGKPEHLLLSWDGRYLASGPRDRTVRLWDTSTSTSHLTLKNGSHFMNLATLTFSDNDQFLIAAPAYHQRIIWDTTNGNCLGTYDYYWGLYLSPDGQQLASKSELGGDNIIMHDVSTGDCTQKVKADAQGRPFLANGNRLVFVSDKDIKVWDILQSRCIAASPMTSPKATSKGRRYPPRRRILLDGQSSSEIEARTRHISTVALSNDSSLIAVYDLRCVQVWDLAAQKLLHELDVRAKSLTFFSDNEFMLYHNISRKTVEILKVKTGTLLHRIQLPRRLSQKEWRLDPGDQSRLCTDFGAIDLTSSLRGADFTIEDAQHQPPHNPQYHGYGLSLDGAWILKGSTRVLCLPLQYRKHAVAVGSTIAVVHEESGRVSVIRFAEDGPGEDGR